MIEKTANITNFIGVYDNYILPEECNKAIQLYEDQNKFNNTFNRITSENASILQKQDQQFFMASNNIDVWWENLKPMMVNFDMALKNYLEQTGAKEAYKDPLHYTSLKIQKTLPTEGYHVWHIEHQKGYRRRRGNRVFTFF